jgi:hypothetical protein
MSVAETSIIAYHEHRDTGKIGKQAQHILNCMDPMESYSRRELARACNLELSSVCGRINELLAVDLVRESPPRKCSITRKMIKPVFKVLLF